MNTTTCTADQRPPYVNQLATATAAITAMIPAGAVRPFGCLVCSTFAEYDDATTAVYTGRTFDGYVCGAACATKLVDTNTPNHRFTFRAIDRKLTVRGRMAV